MKTHHPTIHGYMWLGAKAEFDVDIIDGFKACPENATPQQLGEVVRKLHAGDFAEVTAVQYTGCTHTTFEDKGAQHV